MEDEFWQSTDCEAHTGIPAGTWRYYAHAGKGPASFKLGKRRVWRKSAVLAWIAAQEATSTRGGAA